MKPFDIFLVILYFISLIGVLGFIISSMCSTKVSKELGIKDWESALGCIFLGIIPLVNTFLFVFFFTSTECFKPKGWRKEV